MPENLNPNTAIRANALDVEQIYNKMSFMNTGYSSGSTFVDGVMLSCENKGAVSFHSSTRVENWTISTSGMACFSEPL